MSGDDIAMLAENYERRIEKLKALCLKQAKDKRLLVDWVRSLQATVQRLESQLPEVTSNLGTVSSGSAKIVGSHQERTSARKDTVRDTLLGLEDESLV